MCSEGTPDLGLPDQMMATFPRRHPYEGIIFRDIHWLDEQENGFGH
jgi:hypothetical protein